MSTLYKKYDFEKLEFLMFVLDELADRLSADGKDVIKLTLGKAQEPLHPSIVDAWKNAVEDPAKRNLVYPEGLPLLRDKIAAWYTDWGTPVDRSRILINTGTSPFYKDLFRLLIDDGDEILLPQPYYSVYYISGLLTSAKIKFYNINAETLEIDMDDFRSKYDPSKTKIVVMCSPGNPYGNLITDSLYKEVIDMTSDRTFIVSDEIYRNTGFDGRVPSILDHASDSELQRIIVTNAFSKGFRMYTARVGFSILPTALLEPMRVLLQHTLLTTNPCEQFACVEALNHLEEVEELTKIYKTRNDYTVQAFEDVESVKVISAKGGFYLVIDAVHYMTNNGIPDTYSLAEAIIRKTGVAVVPGSDFGLDTGLRLSFTHLRYDEAIDRLVDFFSE